METNKELIIDWFETIANLLDEKFPTRFNENLVGHRGSELDAVNETVAKCKRCVEYIKKFIPDNPSEKIDEGYKKFDDMYERLEVSPYNAAYDYYKAGYEQCIKDNI